MQFLSGFPIILQTKMCNTRFPRTLLLFLSSAIVLSVLPSPNKYSITLTPSAFLHNESTNQSPRPRFLNCHQAITHATQKAAPQSGYKGSFRSIYICCYIQEQEKTEFFILLLLQLSEPIYGRVLEQRMKNSVF